MKLYSVKCFQYKEIEDIKLNAKGLKKNRREITIVNKDLTWEKAKEICRQYASMGASIFPNVLPEKLKVIRLS